MFSILLKKDHYRTQRDDLIAVLQTKGIDTRPVFYPLHRMPPYKQDGVFPHAEYISDSGINLPSSVTLNEDDIKYICETIKKSLKN